MNFLSELLTFIPEFREIHEREKEYHDIGIHLIFGDFKCFAENAFKESNNDLLKRSVAFIIRCHDEGETEVKNALFVSFFETMDTEVLRYFLKELPEAFSKEVGKFFDGFDRMVKCDK